MRTVNMLEAKSTLSRLVEAIESGAEPGIVIARNGKPAVKLTPLNAAAAGPRIGIAKGLFTVPDFIDDDNAAITAIFEGRRV